MPVKLSIIIPCFNSDLFILEALDSALSQTYDDKEIIIVNDGSNEKTLTILNQISYTNVRILHQKNKGVSSARNCGVLNSNGEFIMFLDADDKFDSTFAQKAINILDSNKKFGFVTCWGKRFSNGKIDNEFRPKGGGIENFLFKNSAIGTSMIRKSIFNFIGGYDENMKNGYEDWEFYIRAIQTCEVHVIEEFLFYYRQHNNSRNKKALNYFDSEIKKYIFEKHSHLYKKYYSQLLTHFFKELDKKEKNISKFSKTLEYQVGSLIIKPFRKLRDLFK